MEGKFKRSTNESGTTTYDMERNECRDVIDRQQTLPSPPPLPSSTQRQLLYVDMMNFGDYVFPIKAPWNMHKSYQKTQQFVIAAKNAGFVIKCFLDDAQKSAEAVKKWRSRREREVPTIQLQTIRSTSSSSHCPETDSHELTGNKWTQRRASGNDYTFG